MPSKLKTAKTMLMVYGIIYIVLGVLFFCASTFFGSLGIFSQDTGDGTFAFALMSGFGVIVGCILAALGIFHIITARALSEKKSWSRVAGIVLGILMLGSFPIGTILGIFILIGLFDTESTSWLENKPQGVVHAK